MSDKEKKVAETETKADKAVKAKKPAKEKKPNKLKEAWYKCAYAKGIYTSWIR